MTHLIVPANLSPALKARTEKVATYTLIDAPLEAHRLKIVDEMAMPQDATGAIDTVHQLQRLFLAGELGLINTPEIGAAILDHDRFPTWRNYASLKAPQDQKNVLARQLYDGRKDAGAPLSLYVGEYARDIGEITLQHCVDHKDEADVWIDDPLFARRLMHYADEAMAAKYGTIMAGRYVGFKRRIVVYSGHPAVPYPDEPAPDAIEKLRRKIFMEQLEKQGWINQPFTGCIMPSRAEAEQDGIPYDEYVRIFFNMCNIDMAEIAKAHAKLIEYLNAGSTVHITNSDGTDITFGIRGMTFLNSLIEANIPGTEVFSAPERESANGVIVAKGIFATPMDSEKRLRDITLEFKDGRIIRYDAVEGLDHLRDQIETDEGSHYLGELAFGTNPALTRHVTNGLLVEKIGGSFHVAIGRAYENQKDAIINNGNQSKVHWDITTMLRGRGGVIKIDDIVIMRDGVYLDPALSYLNGTR